jgi:hypothetical protein
MENQNAAPVSATPAAAPISGSAAAPAQPTTAAQPIETVDFSPLGDGYKDIKVSKAIMDGFMPLLKSQHLTPELLSLVGDGEKMSLWNTREGGYVNAHNERFKAEQTAIKKAQDRMKELDGRQQELEDREKELASIDEDAFFSRSPKVREAERYARKQVEQERWTPEEAEAYVKPYIETAKGDYKKQAAEKETRLNAIIEQNSEIGKTTFPEFDPHLASCIVDGLMIGGSEPKEAALLFRKELDRVIEYEKAKAVANYVKSVNEKQPDTPGLKPVQPIPSGGGTNEFAESVQRGQTIFGTLFGGK